MKRIYYQAVDIESGEILKTIKSTLLPDDASFHDYLDHCSYHNRLPRIPGKGPSDTYFEALTMEEFIASTPVQMYTTVGFKMYVPENSTQGQLHLSKSSYEDVLYLENDESKYVQAIAEIIRKKKKGIFEKLNISDIPETIDIQYFTDKNNVWSEFIPIRLSDKIQTNEIPKAVATREPLKILVQGLDENSQIFVEHVSVTSAEITIKF